jgi:probable rRNA maturation factor
VPCVVVNRQARLPFAVARLARAALRALVAVGRSGGDVEVLVVDDVEIRRLNGVWRGVPRRTDVLAFPMETPGGSAHVGQIVISIDSADRQARRVGVPLGDELELLATHGVLHLVGYDDRDPVESRLMHERERSILGPRASSRLWAGLLT